MKLLLTSNGLTNNTIDNALFELNDYVLNDNSAIKINDDRIEVVSEGEWFIINNNLTS